MDDEIREAVRLADIVERNIDEPNWHKIMGKFPKHRKAIRSLIDLATQYLSLTKENGVPEERNEDFNANNFKEVFNRNLGFNEARSLFLPLLLKSRKECEKKDQCIAELEEVLITIKEFADRRKEREISIMANTIIPKEKLEHSQAKVRKG